MSSLKKNLPLIAGIVVVLGVVFYMIWLRPEPVANVTVSGSGPMTDAYNAFLALSAQLEPGGFDETIFTDERFTSLVDIKVSIVPEPAGRINPFGPLQ